MLVKSIMTKNFETASRDQTLYELVETMLKNDVDHIVVMEDDTPSAIITRRKVLIATYKTDKPLSEIPVSGFGRGLEITIGPNSTVLLSVGKLQKAKAECIPVVDGMDIVGVMTRDDVIDNVSKITDDVLEHDGRRTEWTDE